MPMPSSTAAARLRSTVIGELAPRGVLPGMNWQGEGDRREIYLRLFRRHVLLSNLGKVWIDYDGPVQHLSSTFPAP